MRVPHLEFFGVFVQTEVCRHHSKYKHRRTADQFHSCFQWCGDRNSPTGESKMSFTSDRETVVLPLMYFLEHKVH